MHITASKLRRFITDWGYSKYVVQTQIQRRTREFRLRHFGYALPPKTVILQITGLCNRRCRQCAQWGEAGAYHVVDKKTLSLDLKTIHSVLDEVTPFAPDIQLLGGEPTIHPDFDAVLTGLSERNLGASLETNGTNLSKWAQRLCKSSVHTINLSIDGPERIHDKIRGENTFAPAMRGTEDIFRIRESLGKDTPRVNVRMTISEDNYDKIAETAELFRNKPIAMFTVQHLIYTHKDILEENGRVLQRIRPDYQQALCIGLELPETIDGQVISEQISKITEPGAFPFGVVQNPNYPTEYIQHYYRDARLLPTPPFTCRSPQEALAIGCLNDIAICSHYFVGKLGQAPLMDIWNGKLARKFRKFLIRNRTIPACKICCYPSSE